MEDLESFRVAAVEGEKLKDVIRYELSNHGMSVSIYEYCREEDHRLVYCIIRFRALDIFQCFGQMIIQNDGFVTEFAY